MPDERKAFTPSSILFRPPEARLIRLRETGLGGGAGYRPRVP